MRVSPVKLRRLKAAVRLMNDTHLPGNIADPTLDDHFTGNER
jgi:hypothetical protein